MEAAPGSALGLWPWLDLSCQGQPPLLLPCTCAAAAGLGPRSCHLGPPLGHQDCTGGHRGLLFSVGKSPLSSLYWSLTRGWKRCSTAKILAGAVQGCSCFACSSTTNLGEGGRGEQCPGFPIVSYYCPGICHSGYQHFKLSGQ